MEEKSPGSVPDSALALATDPGAVLELAKDNENSSPSIPLDPLLKDLCPLPPGPRPDPSDPFLSPLKSKEIVTVEDLGSEMGNSSDYDLGTDNETPINNDKLKSTSDVEKVSLLSTFEPFVVPDLVYKGDECVLKLEYVSLEMNFELIYNEYKVLGSIREIRIKLSQSFKHWIAYIRYESHSEALHAYDKRKDIETCSLDSKIPANLDVYYPPVRDDKPEVPHRPSLPPNWLIVTTKTERANLYSFRKLLKHKVGDLENKRISRFGRSSFLIHAKSPVQATMILNLKTDGDSVIKEVKPHYNFSFAKGVIYNRDLYDLSEEEILEMCPINVVKVFKIPRTFMIVLTFHDEVLPHYIYVDGERMEIRPYKQRPLQCYKCFGFGHSSRNCGVNDQFCF